MPHLAVLRRGWENEHLAAFLLSRCAFVAHPAKIGDDVGTDFFCTFFEATQTDGRTYLVPRNSFAIQVKSGGISIDASKQVGYLARLELPFFVGIVNQKKLALRIYSGEYLPILFSHKGVPTSLTLKLCHHHDFATDEYCRRRKGRDNAYELKCPEVAYLTADADPETIEHQAKRLRHLATRVQSNIAARASEEYIFSVGPEGKGVMIMAGCGSAQVFRDNFKKRLAEVFYNLDWILANRKGAFDMDEFRFYEQVYDQLLAREGDVPCCLKKVAENVKNRVRNG